MKKIGPTLKRLEGLNVNDTANDNGKWITNDDVSFDYSSGVDFQSSSISIDIFSEQVHRVYSLAPFYTSTQSSIK